MYKLREKLVGAEYRGGEKATLTLMTLNNQTGGKLSRLCMPTLLPSLTITLTKAVSSLPVLTIISVVAFNFMVQEP